MLLTEACSSGRLGFSHAVWRPLRVDIDIDEENLFDKQMLAAKMLYDEEEDTVTCECDGSPVWKLRRLLQSEVKVT